MRYYQAALDMSILDKGLSYNHLVDSIVVFVCLFDVIGKHFPLYTFENICLEDKNTGLQDGTKKVILNAAGYKQAEDEPLRGFLEYLKTGRITTDFTRRLETMVQAVRTSEQARQEYQWVSGHIMDARDSRFSQGAYQTKRETVRLMKQAACDTDFIVKMTGLSREEIEAL